MLNKNNHLKYHIFEGKRDLFNISNIIRNREDGDVTIPLDNKINKYMNLLKSNSTLIELSDEEFEKYKYKPRIMSQDLYKTQELWYILMKLNGILDVSKFDRRSLYVLNFDAVKIVNDIYINEGEEDYGYI